MPISLHLHENFLGFHLQDAHNASLKIQYVFWAVSPLPRSKGMKILRFGGAGGRFLEKTVDFFWRDGILFVYLQCGDGIEAEKGSLTYWIRDIGRCSLTKYEDVLQCLHFF